jgi:hypothetical protein
MEMTPSKILFLLATLIFAGCVETDETDPPIVVAGYRPVYGEADANEIKLVASRDVKNPGKIYVYGKYLLVNEINEGIHIFDNQSPSNPKPVGFIQILGNSDMAIKDAKLYADHAGNIVSVTINDFTSVSLNGSLPLQNWNLGLPPPSGSHFECIDQSKGLVVAWKKVQLTNPDCYALY